MEYNRLYFFSQHIMIGNPRPDEENIIIDVRNPFRLEKLKKKQLIPQLKTEEIFLDQKKKIK